MRTIPELKGMIGLEIHTYLVTREKLFCTCKSSRERGLQPNIYICPICTGQPGAKPMLPNRNAVEKAVLIGLLLGCTINSRLLWQRKHYDWPDLPKGYQNTLSGKWATPVGVSGKFYSIGISSMHLEEDPASWEPSTGKIDYNRYGLPLVEIVTEPDFSTAEEVVDWLRKLVHGLSYLKAVDPDAGIKVDVNVNIPGKTERVEIKNLNSLESIQEAILYELNRQMREGNSWRETRRFDAATGKTMRMRSKESGEDYRFIADPDLHVLILDDDLIEHMRQQLPENPDDKLKRLVSHYKLDRYYADILTKNIDLVEFYEAVAQKIDPKFALPWVTVELLRFLNYNKTTLDKADIKIEHFVELLCLVKDGKITELQAKQLLNQFYPKSFMPSDVASKITSEHELNKVIQVVIAANSKAVSDYKTGEQKAFDFLMGKIMEATQKRADFRIARVLLQKLLR